MENSISGTEPSLLATLIPSHDVKAVIGLVLTTGIRF
jgi:hypothetical protein